MLQLEVLLQIEFVPFFKTNRCYLNHTAWLGVFTVSGNPGITVAGSACSGKGDAPAEVAHTRQTCAGPHALRNWHRSFQAKVPNPSGDKNATDVLYCGGGKSLLLICDPGSELRLVIGRGGSKKCEDGNWNGKKKNEEGKKKADHLYQRQASARITSPSTKSRRCCLTILLQSSLILPPIV